MFGKKEETRFAILHQESTAFLTSCTILVDKQTGVNYLMTASTNSMGLTPLLDAQGKVVVSTRAELDELQYK